MENTAQDLATLAEQRRLASSFEADVREVLGGILAMLLRKNAAYGDSALSPLRIFSRADLAEQLKVRIDDKLSRLARGSGEETEDVERDLMGYLVLLRVARARAKRGAT